MTTTAEWLTPPSVLTLPDNEIHVWRASLDLDPSLLHQLNSSLAPDELARAARFKFDRDRYHFIAARGILRVVLSIYLQQEPASLVFVYGPHGKPALMHEKGDRSLRFNLSHSHGIALYAIAHAREVGIDVEALRAKADCEDIARRFFSKREYLEIQAQPQETRADAFFRCWTRKEAYIKARGLGMTIPLNSFEVSLSPHALTELQSLDSHRWSLRGLEPATGYIGAVAGEGRDWQIRCWNGLVWSLTDVDQPHTTDR